MSSNDFLELERVRSRLSQVWFAGCGFVFLVLLLQSLGSVYRGQLSEVWGWAMPNMLPTLSLIISVLGADALVSRDQDDEAQAAGYLVRRSFYRVAFWLSIVYVILILIAILAQPMMLYFHSGDPVSAADITGGIDSDEGETAAQASPADMLKISNLWLAPVQSLVIAALGVLFFTKKKPQ